MSVPVERIPGEPGIDQHPQERGRRGWWVKRLGLKSVMEDQFNRVVPRHATNYIYCFGGIALLLFIILAVTGIMLAIYYVPTPDKAYQSVLDITQRVQFGWWIRSIHKWAAGGMVLLVFAHMLRVFFDQAPTGAAGAQLADRRAAAGAHAGLSASPAICCPGTRGVLGHQGRHGHRRLGAVRRALPAGAACGAATRSVPPRSGALLRPAHPRRRRSSSSCWRATSG